MATERELELSCFTVHTPIRKGVDPEWSFPEVCACCGAPAEAYFPQRLRFDSTRKKWSYNAKVPYCGLCIAHVDARARSTSTTTGIALFVTILVVVGGLFGWWKNVGGSLQNFLDDIFTLPVLAAAVIPLALFYFVVETVLTRAMGSSGAALATTEACTMPLRLALIPDKIRLMTDGSKMVVRMTCGCAAFSDAFEATNEEFITEKELMNGTLERTPRGDWILKGSKRVAQAGEPAGV